MNKLRQLILESIGDYIREIDETGNMAALEAKIGKTQEAIELREKKMNMDGLDEAYHDMLDKGKMKELDGEVKALKKSLVKLEKQLEKLKSKSDKSPKIKDTEEKEIVDEAYLNENRTAKELFQMFKDEDLLNDRREYDVEDLMSTYPDLSREEAQKLETMLQNQIDETANSDIYEILHMQKLAGIISESEYVAKINKAKKMTATQKEKKKALNEDKLVLSNYAKQLYSLFKKAGATPLIQTGAKRFASPDVKNYNVSILVTNNDELMVGIKGDKATATKYSNLVAKQFPDLQLKGDIKISTGWGGEKDSYADLILIPKTTKKGGAVNPNQRSNAPKPTV